ncbi:hypothetical protein JXA70_05000 [candidate division KSB1 bacterium]|nr:hypothetical protein [candidate division KSB1 bacterium]
MPEKSTLLDLIEQHLKRHQCLGIQDVYKMLYQGVCGAEHLLVNTEHARKSLVEEWHRVQADTSGILTESVSLDGRIVRVNLRRCKAEGYVVDNVWLALYRSTAQVNADKVLFDNVWLQFVQLCQAGALPFDFTQATQFGMQAKAANWPVKHHSAAYREANRPAYRVVLRRIFKEIVDEKR